MKTSKPIKLGLFNEKPGFYPKTSKFNKTYWVWFFNAGFSTLVLLDNNCIQTSHLWLSNELSELFVIQFYYQRSVKLIQTN